MINEIIEKILLTENQAKKIIDDAIETSKFLALQTTEEINNLKRHYAELIKQETAKINKEAEDSASRICEQIIADASKAAEQMTAEAEKNLLKAAEKVADKITKGRI